MTNSVQMWWLDLGSEKLLTIFCPLGEVMEKPFCYAATYIWFQLELSAPISRSLNYDRSEDVGSEQCSDRMKQVIACLPDKVG